MRLSKSIMKVHNQIQLFTLLTLLTQVVVGLRIAARLWRLSLCPLGAAGRCLKQRRLTAKAARLEPLRFSSCTRSLR